MRLFVLAFLFPFACFAADPSWTTLTSGPPSSAVDAQNQTLFLTSKIKSLAEVQALLLKQQQLILEHLDALRQEVAKLELDRTNFVPRSEWENAWRELDHWRQQMDSSRRTVSGVVVPLPSDTNQAVASAPVQSSTGATESLASLLRRLSTANTNQTLLNGQGSAGPGTSRVERAEGFGAQTDAQPNPASVANLNRPPSPETNPPAPIAAVRPPGLTNAASASLVSTNSSPVRFDAYRVQPGDTLSKIIARWNDGLDVKGLPRVTQEEVEKANPNLNPDLIRVGQRILIPAR